VRYAFRVLSTFRAEVEMDTQKEAIVRRLVCEAEKLDLGTNDYAIFDVNGLPLKAVVRFASRVIHVMSREEYDESLLPGSARRAKEGPPKAK
jgi:hypothetical protein